MEEELINFGKQYLTWEEYQGLGGTLTESAFKLLEFEARKKIDEQTFGRLIDLASQNEEVKLCVFRLIGVINENKSTVISESVDGYGITILDKKELRNTIKTIIKEYLSECKLADGTPYLYRGETRRFKIW